MSSINQEKIKNVINLGDANGGKRNIFKSPLKNDKLISKENISISESEKGINFNERDSNNYVHEITEDKNQKLFKGFLQKFNNMGDIGLNENNYMLPLNTNNLTVLTDTNIYENNNSTVNNITPNSKNNLKKNKQMKNLSMNNNNVIDIQNIKNINLNTNIHPNNLSPKKSNTYFTESFNDPYDSKYSIKINKIKDDYIDFLQKEFEDNTKKSVKLDSNNKELLKKCDDLIHDNRLLSNTLNDRTAKLNKIIQENLTVKSQLDKILLLNQKNEQKLEFYEEQFNLYKTSNENYQKIIEELKAQIDQLNNSIIETQKTHEENLKDVEDNYNKSLKLELENNKKEMEEFYEDKNKKESEINEQKFQEMIEHIKNLEEKNDELSNELNKKESMFDMVCKENEKLTGENNLFRNEIEQYTHQINELNTIIKHKDNIINNLKVENLNNEKFLNKSSSCSMMKFDGSEYINENISKLITDNEENKMKIELLNDKIKNIDEIERKYNEIVNGSRTLSLSEKLSFQLNSNNTSPKNSNKNSGTKTHFNYNNFNEIKNSTYQKNVNNNSNYRNLVSPKKLQLQGVEDIEPNSPRTKTKYEKTDYKTKFDDKNKNKNIIISSNVTNTKLREKNNKNSTYVSTNNISNINNNSTYKSNVIDINKTKNGIDREIKVVKRTNKTNVIKETKEISLPRKPDLSPNSISSKYYQKNNEEKKIIYDNDNKKVHGKELEEEKDELKESIREMNRKKNFTHKPKNVGISIEEEEQQKNGGPKITIIHAENEEEEIITEKYYLYGIDRDDLLHVFDICAKQWSGLRKITELKDISDTFKKDYQYEGTLLYNTLTGLYILTGEKTDILYYYNSLTNTISKICKFNTSHDNGGIFLDNTTNCLYVLGGKKSRSCEYYSFNDKKIYKLPDLTIDRANASYIVSNNKIYGFFGFCYSKNTYTNSIEYIDFNRKDRWIELKNIQLLKNNISFDMKSVSTMYYKNNKNLILIYSGIQGDDEDFVTEYYLVYDTKNNTMDKINKWNLQQYKSVGKKWKSYTLKKNDPKGFHFAKNSRFLNLPKNNSYEGYSDRDNIDIMIDYKNNVHFVLQEKQKIDIYRNEL